MTAEAGLPPEFQVVERGGVVLTANRRLAAHLRARHDRARADAGQAAWEVPEVLPLGAWIERTWQAGWPEETLLADHQAEAVWEAVVRERPHGTDLIDPGLLVRRAAEAHRLCLEWDVPLDDADPFLSREARVFLDWRAAFLEVCRARRRLDRGAAVERLVGWIAGGAVAPPGNLSLAGFDRIPPRIERLLDAMRGRGTEVRAWDGPRFPEPRARRVAAADPCEEAVLAARWARGLLERGEPGPIGIVCPRLEEVRAPLARALRDQLAPGAVRDLAGPPVNFSLGVPLASTPGAAAALGLLGVGEGPAETVALCALLRSEALAGAGPEADARARLAARMAERGGVRVTLGRVRAALQAPGAPPAPRLAALLERWAGHLARQRGRRRPSAWARAFSELLADLGWPGERPGSVAWQAARKFHEALGALSALDGVAAPLEREAAFRRLAHLARETPFQPEGPDTAVQVMGTLEAAGLAFRHLWLMGMADTAWPPPPAANPFIPFALQRDHGLPGATAEVQLAHARRVTERLLAAAPDVVVSHPARVEDRQLSVSPLLAHLPEAPPEALEPAPDRRHVRAIHAARPRLESLADDDGPPLAPGEGAVGGVGVFADQAACPFRAFALRRLAAVPVEEPHAGLDARERGTLAHRMMEAVWRELGDRDALAALSDAALQARLAPLARQVVAGFPAGAQGAPAFADLEAARLVRMAAEWLALERERGPFTVALAEAPVPAEVGGVAVALRVDRVDRLADGGLALIDYKTGRTEPEEWFGARPTAPQLPLYAVSLPAPPVAVAYARLKRGDMGFAGVWEPGGPLPGKPLAPEKREGGEATWPGMLDGWRRALAALGEAFRAGRAPVDPKADEVCRYCPLPPLCRIDERREALGDDG